MGRRPLDGRPRRTAGTRTRDLARHRPGRPGRLAHLVDRQHHRPQLHRETSTDEQPDDRQQLAQQPPAHRRPGGHRLPGRHGRLARRPRPHDDDAAATRRTTGDPASSSTQSAGVEQTAPETAPTGGVVIPGGADQANGYPTGFPQTDLGAVALQIEVAKAQVGFDYDQAVTVAGLYADPADKAVFEERARDAVALRRQQAGVPKDGDVPAPASYAVTPIAYTLEELGTDYYAVNLLSYVTLTTADGEVKDGLYAGTQLMRWLEVDGAGTGGWSRAAPRTSSTWSTEGQPQAVAPDTPSSSGPAGCRSTASCPVTAPTSRPSRTSRGSLIRIGIGALAVLLLTTLLGAASTLQPPAAAAADTATSTTLTTAAPVRRVRPRSDRRPPPSAQPQAGLPGPRRAVRPRRRRARLRRRPDRLRQGRS